MAKMYPWECPNCGLKQNYNKYNEYRQCKRCNYKERWIGWKTENGGLPEKEWKAKEMAEGLKAVQK